MDHSEKQQSMDNNRDVDEVEEQSMSKCDVSSTEVRTSGTSGLIVEENDSDLLFQRFDRENNVLQWFQALDMHVMGACRVDERLKPLLKQNVATGAAEDRLLAHLSQHFEPAEVGMLARCLCIPLVSIRVGKIKKQGTLLCPTSTRGNLKLTLLPTSELRISFIGDDGCAERLATFYCESDCAAVEIKNIATDKSGRSFLINIPNGDSFYFWCSEKSKLLGDELQSKLKDLLNKKPSLSDLTGISETRLDCFTIHLRAYLIDSAVANAQASSSLSTNPSVDGCVDSSELGVNVQASVASHKSLRSRHYNGQGPKTSAFHLGSLSPRSSSFKESLLRNTSSLRVGKDKLRRRGDSHLSCTDNQIAGTPSRIDVYSSTCIQDNYLPTETSAMNVLEPLVDLPFLGPAATIPSLDSTVVSPYYCWCPPAASTLQYSVGTPHLPILCTDSLSLPQLFSIAPARSSSVLIPKQPLTFTGVSSLDLPPLLPDSLIRLPLSLSASQQIPSFTPLMCDSIVHIPVIDVCSSGQGYMVSAGPAISGALPSLHPNFVNPLMPETESAVEKSARETLRLLINSSNQHSLQLIDVLPSALSSRKENQNMLASGSRGLYSGTIDVDAIANGFATMGLVSRSDWPVGRVNTRQISTVYVVDHMEKPETADEFSTEEGCTDFEEELKYA